MPVICRFYEGFPNRGNILHLQDSLAVVQPTYANALPNMEQFFPSMFKRNPKDAILNRITQNPVQHDHRRAINRHAAGKTLNLGNGNVDRQEKFTPSREVRNVKTPPVE